MSQYPPITNNITLSKFYTHEIDFVTPNPSIVFGKLDYDGIIFEPLAGYIIFTNVIGSNQTGSVYITDGRGTEMFQVTIPSSPLIIDKGNGTGRRSAVPFSFPTNPIVFGGVDGLAGLQNLTLTQVLPTYPSLNSATRSTSNNISTLTFQSNLPASMVKGSIVTVYAIQNAGYNGQITILSTTANSISYYNPNIVNEASTADTQGFAGAVSGYAVVHGVITAI